MSGCLCADLRILCHALAVDLGRPQVSWGLLAGEMGSGRTPSGRCLFCTLWHCGYNGDMVKSTQNDESHLSIPGESAQSPMQISTLLPLLQESLTRTGRLVLPLNGTSMHPTLPLVCRVEIVPVTHAEKLPLGSLIVFGAGDALITHRLVARRMIRGRLHWIAQGDGRRAADGPILPEQVLGQVERAVDGSGRILWPRRGEQIWARGWILRHHLLRAMRPWAAPLARRLGMIR